MAHVWPIVSQGRAIYRSARKKSLANVPCSFLIILAYLGEPRSQEWLYRYAIPEAISFYRSRRQSDKCRVTATRICDCRKALPLVSRHVYLPPFLGSSGSRSCFASLTRSAIDLTIVVYLGRINSLDSRKGHPRTTETSSNDFICLPTLMKYSERRLKVG